MLGLSFANSKQAWCCFVRLAASRKLLSPLSLPVAVDAASAVVNWDWTADIVSTFAPRARGGAGAPAAPGSRAAGLGACSFSATGCTSCVSESLSATPGLRWELTAQPPITATATSTMGIQRCRLSQSSLPEYTPSMFPFLCRFDFSNHRFVNSLGFPSLRLPMISVLPPDDEFSDPSRVRQLLRSCVLHCGHPTNRWQPAFPDSLGCWIDGRTTTEIQPRRGDRV